MYVPELSGNPSVITSSAPVNTSRFTLNTSGVSGFFGGDEAISAMATVHIYTNRQWLGWYNTPGSFQIARKYGRIANSTPFKGFFPGVRISAAKLFELDGWQGPAFRGASSGTIMNSTGHPASILMKECAATGGIPIEGRRKASPVDVTIVKLHKVPDDKVYPARITDCITFVLAVFSVATSLSASVVSAIYRDWFSFSLIVWGVLSNGISCAVIGSGTLYFTHPKPADGVPRGDGILSFQKEFVLLQGDEGAVNSITRGHFSLEFPSEHYDQYIGYCSILLTIQFVAQLLFIPQASFFGQIMFLSSLAVSWICNLCLSVSDKEKNQRQILMHGILESPSLKKYTLHSYTAAVVFALCVLKPDDPRKFVDAYLPNNTDVWRVWKKITLRRLKKRTGGELHFTEEDLKDFTDEKRELLQTLYRDAEDAYNGFLTVGIEKAPVGT